jgi:hypothetical protein
LPVQRLIIFCEGQTEENFCNLVLEPHFRGLGVLDMRPLLLPTKVGSTERRHKGGWIKYSTARDYILRVLASQHSPGTWFSTLLDLYAIPEDFPALAAAPITPARVRIESLETAFGADVQAHGYYRFTSHLQLHEYEALLLADCDAIGRALPDRPNLAAALRGETLGLEPEEVDGGRETAPSKRIIKHAPEYDGLKASAGPLIAHEIGLPTLRSRCPHFDAWIVTLEGHVAGD